MLKNIANAAILISSCTVVVACSSTSDWAKRNFYSHSYVSSVSGKKKAPSWVPPAPQVAAAKKVNPENWRNYKVGTPYRALGQEFEPREQPDYDEVGIASWYGAEFHNRSTANGEVFDKNIVSAAHPTLPMPSIVRVTNLENGRTMQVRVNDRGPFKHDRVIDLSEAAAKKLGVWGPGTAKVRVQFDQEATERLFYDTDYADSSEPNVHKAYHATSPVRNPSIASSFGQRHTNFGEYYIQTGAYSSRVNADEVKDKLEKMGPVLVEETELRGDYLYRVKMGPFAGREQADAALNDIASIGFSDAVILVD